MRFRRKMVGLSLSCAMVAAVGVGAAGTAHAQIRNDLGTKHWENGADDQQCLMNDPNTGLVEAWRCLNAPSEEWSAEGPPRSPFNLVNFWTGDCMAVAGYPSNGTLITHVPCNASDASQLWRLEEVEEFNGAIYYRFHSILNQDQCLDKPKGVNADGTPIQMWKCASQDNPNPLDPFFNYHKEQYWTAV
jgi:hypothetical protein